MNDDPAPDVAVLIEALAKAQYEEDPDYDEWEALPESIQASYRATVSSLVPVIAEFVARWLDDRVFLTAARYWREGQVRAAKEASHGE